MTPSPDRLVQEGGSLQPISVGQNRSWPSATRQRGRPHVTRRNAARAIRTGEPAVETSASWTRSTKTPLAQARTTLARGLTMTLLALSVALTGCTTNPYTGEEQASNTAKGAGIGAAGGALVGAIAAGSRKSVLLGLGIGALVGAGIGAYMDREEEKLRQQLRGAGVSVTRDGNDIILNIRAGQC